MIKVKNEKIQDLHGKNPQYLRWISWFNKMLNKKITFLNSDNLINQVVVSNVDWLKKYMKIIEYFRH